MIRKLARGGKHCPQCGREMDRRAAHCINCRKINPAGQVARRRRSADLLGDYRNGITVADLSVEHGITIERINQLLRAGRVDEMAAQAARELA